MLPATGSKPERPTMEKSQRQRDAAAKSPSSPTEREREKERRVVCVVDQAGFGARKQWGKKGYGGTRSHKILICP